MRLVRAVEGSKNYQLNVYEYWEERVKSIVNTYGIINVHTGVIEVGPTQSLEEAKAFLQQLEDMNYPAVEGSEPLDPTPEVKPH